MGAFLEELLPVTIRVGMQLREMYEVKITETSGGSEYRSLTHQYPKIEADISYVFGYDDLRAQVKDLYHRAYGEYAGFRVRAYDYFSTAPDDKGAHSFSDQDLILSSTGIYQFVKRYGTEGAALSIGHPYRILRKIKSGTALIGIRDAGSNNVQVLQGSPSRWTIDITTGLIAFATNYQRTITGITQAVSAVVTVGSGHSHIVNDTVHFSSVSGMTEINGLRGTVLSTASSTITVDINTTGFTPYTSGGQTNTRPQSGETVTGGCEFDIPMRFDGPVPVNFLGNNVTETSLHIIELLNP